MVLKFGILASLGLISISAKANQAYFDLDGVRYTGEATLVADTSVRIFCTHSYKGEIVLTDNTSLPIKAAFKFCGWVGPGSIFRGGSVILPDNKIVKLNFVTPPIDTNTDQ